MTPLISSPSPPFHIFFGFSVDPETLSPFSPPLPDLHMEELPATHPTHPGAFRSLEAVGERRCRYAAATSGLVGVLVAFLVE